MRIIAGEFRSRSLKTPPDATITRPMPDRVRESIFNLLRGHFEGENVMDVFAGVGTMGLEAVSRGAAHCVFVEQSRDIARLLRENIETLHVGDRAEVVQSDALGNASISAGPNPVHIIFFDPPYAMVQDPERRERCLAQFGRLVQRLDDSGFAVLRTPWPLIETAQDRRGENVDLTIEGAQGPETHEFGSMAAHLYMKRPS